MPVEIRELHITTIVHDSPAQQTGGSSSSTAAPNHDAVVAACVEQVLEILQQKIER
jgi:hypothetical protein